MLAGSRLAELGSPAVVISGCTNPRIVDAWCSQYPVTCLQAKKREGELATRVSAMEAEMQSAQAVAAQSTAVVDDLRSQLTVRRDVCAVSTA